MRRSLPSALIITTLAVALLSCARENDAREGADAEPPSPSYSVIPVPPRELTGTLDAVLKQSSRDAARDRFQVWIFNGTEKDVEPTTIRYVDPRLTRPIDGQRVRTMPSGLERGYPMPLPEPRCGGVTREAPAVVVEAGGRTERLAVADDLRIIQRYVDATCFERAVRSVVGLAWDDSVPAEGGTATLTLVVTPTGNPGRLEILRVGGTPVLDAPGRSGWRDVGAVDGDGPAQRIELPILPARCDSHAFFEAGGATAFRLRLRLDGEVGEFVLRMSPTGARAAIAYAIGACGLDQ